MRQERVYRTEGIVLREMDYGEADRILTFLTPGGKLRAIAKGVRRPTSRKGAQLGLFRRVQLMGARGRNLDIITQAQSLEDLDGLRTDLLRFGYASYAAELADCFSSEEEECGPLYELFQSILRSCSSEGNLQLAMRHFEWQLLEYSGYRPELHTCVGCHAVLEATVNAFSAAQGGMLCPRCGETAQGVPVTVGTQKVLRYLSSHAPAEIRALSVTQSTQAEIESVLGHYLEYVLERELRSAAVLRRLRRELANSSQGAA